jgi:hypothetical protein
MQQQYISFPQTQYHFPAGMSTDKIRRIIHIENTLAQSPNPAIRRCSVLPEPVIVEVKLPIPTRSTKPAVQLRPPLGNNPRKGRRPATT